MQDTSGLKSFLSVSWVYKYFQNLVGAAWLKNWLAANYWKLSGGEKVVDIGCGPGDVLEYLPKNLEYIGFDLSQQYIETAQQRWGKRGTFLVSTPGQLLDRPDDRLNGADLVMCNGVLHHLDDQESLEVFKLAKSILAPGGRFVSYEPVFLAHQDRISKWILGRDRGRHVRLEKEWKKLISHVFDDFNTDIATNLIRIPYTYIIIECRKQT